jgi:hypothetical protein
LEHARHGGCSDGAGRIRDLATHAGFGGSASESRDLTRVGGIEHSFGKLPFVGWGQIRL